MPSQLPFIITVAALPNVRMTPQEFAEALAARFSISTEVAFALIRKGADVSTSDEGLFYNETTQRWMAWNEDDAEYQNVQTDASDIGPGNLGVNGTINITANGKIFNPAYPEVLFRRNEVAIAVTDPYISGTGTTFDFTLPTPCHFVGPGHADAAAGTIKILNPDDDGRAFIQYSARIIGDAPDVTEIAVFLKVNDGAAQILAALSSDDDGNQSAHGFRELTGLNPTDSFKFYCAPCSGSGAIPVSVNCRVELDIMAING